MREKSKYSKLVCSESKESQLYTYQKQAGKTIPEGFTKQIMLNNSVYGLVSEFGELVDLLKKAKFQGHELDKEKAILELGDVLWYLAELCTGLNFNLYDYYETHKKSINQAFESNEIYIIGAFNYAIFRLLGQLHTFSEKEIIFDFLTIITCICKNFNTTIEDVATKNIEKLRKRYGEKFDQQKNVNRVEAA